MSTVGTISEIRRYPVKSMQGELLSRATLGPTGIAGDRLYGVRDIAAGKVLSAKTPKVGVALLSCSAHITESGATIVSVGGRQFEVGDSELDQALSALLDREVRIERATGSDEVYESYWPELEGMALSDAAVDFPIAMSTVKGTFVDLAALHVLATSSVVHLGSLNSDLTLTMDRFRPGIAIDTVATEGFVEKEWAGKSGTIGGASIAFGTESPRCIMTTLDQLDLPRQPSVLQTMARHNRVNFDGFGNFACLGVYAEVSTPGEIAVGDALSVFDAQA
jgi:uncharacterized protein